MRELANLTAILTGASGGIGPHIAQALAAERMNLVLVARSADKLENITAEVRAVGVKAISIPTDVADQKSLEALVARVNDEFGAIDVLVNNAGIDKFWTFHKTEAEHIESMARVNLVGPILLTWMVLPGMLGRQRGHIVNMSSMGGKLGLPCNEVYSATKAGLIGFTRSLRSEYRGTGVSASVICPGLVEAGIYHRTREKGASAAPWMVGTTTPEAVARAVVRAIKADVLEIIVNPGFLTKRFPPFVLELAPSFGEWLLRCIGLTNWCIKGAEGYEREAIQPGRDT